MFNYVETGSIECDWNMFFVFVCQDWIDQAYQRHIKERPREAENCQFGSILSRGMFMVHSKDRLQRSTMPGCWAFRNHDSFETGGHTFQTHIQPQMVWHIARGPEICQRVFEESSANDSEWIVGYRRALWHRLTKRSPVFAKAKQWREQKSLGALGGVQPSSAILSETALGQQEKNRKRSITMFAFQAWHILTLFLLCLQCCAFFHLDCLLKTPGLDMMYILLSQM